MTTIILTKEQADAMADYEPSPEAMKNLFAAADRYRERNMLEHGTDKPVMPCALDLTGDSTVNPTPADLVGRGLVTPVMHYATGPAGYWFRVTNKGKRRFGKRCVVLWRFSKWRESQSGYF